VLHNLETIYFTMNDKEQRQRETLARFSAAWSTGDVNTLLELMSDEPVYKGSTGPEPGTVCSGRDAVRAAFERMTAGNKSAVPGTPQPPPESYFFGNRALVYWRLALPGAATEVSGVDVLTFTDDGRIAVKDAYRKAFS
jgi:hypothetical protein